KKGVCSTPMYDDLESGRRKELAIEECTLPTIMNDDLSHGTAFRIHLDIAGSNRRVPRLLDTLDEKSRTAFYNRLDKDGSAYLFAMDANVPEGWPPLPTLVVSGRDAKALDAAVSKLMKQIETETITLPSEAIAGPIPDRADYGLAILNQGHALAGMENDGTMILPLMHNAGWAYVAWGKDRLPFFFVSEWKTHKFTYALYSHEGSWRDANVPAAAMDYNNPLIARQLSSHSGFLPKELSFLEVEDGSLIVTAMKPTGNPTASLSGAEVDSVTGVILRLYEAFGRKAKADIKLFTGISGAASLNLLEEKEKKLSVSAGVLNVGVNPFSVETYELVPGQIPGKLDSKSLARESEIAPVQHIRYWQHNLGADPIGYLPVTVALSGEIKTGIHIPQGDVTINTFKLGIANNYIDRKTTGTVELIVPDGWKVIPDKIDYTLAPGESCVKELLLSFLSRRRAGVIKARIEYEGQVFQDIIEVGPAHLLECKTKVSAKEVTVTITNPTDIAIEGQLDLITPIETWPITGYPDFAQTDTSPWRYGFQLDPGESSAFTFPIVKAPRDKATPKQSHWAIARLVYNGHVHYERADGQSYES
ncbi:MAG: hypothetical protein Q7N50_05485, partial [Armatimonadota bacterium]|nr:hypothetical protein [Armatimonadota bacterium]